MSLRLIIGGSGTGKTRTAIKTIIDEAARNKNGRFFVIVPEQFTLKTQKALAENSPGRGILNIDVLSFQRLAYRVMEETGGDARKLLDDISKTMILKVIGREKKSDLPYLGSQMERAGCLDEVKSLISEFMQYEIGEEGIAAMREAAQSSPLLSLKLSDMEVLYRSFRAFLKDRYMTGEETMDRLADQAAKSKLLVGSCVLFDGFTGFTPIQLRVLGVLLGICREVLVTVNMDASLSLPGKEKKGSLFAMSHRMIASLMSLTRDVSEPVRLYPGENDRYQDAPSLRFLEQELFRYRQKAWDKPSEAITLFSAENPEDELWHVAEKIRSLIRTRGMRYGDMAVITGNLEEYGPLARRVFERAGIPFFIDEKRGVSENPVSTFILSALRMVAADFSLESVLRYLRCGLSVITDDDADRVENYCRALGIKFYSYWKKPWKRVYRGLDPEELDSLNALRESFLEETAVLKEGFGEKERTVLSYCRYLYDFITGCHMEEKIWLREEKFQEEGEVALAREYGQITRVIMDLLDQMADILGRETISREDFISLLETGLGKAKVAIIPPGQDQVLVGDMERTRLSDIRALFFIGANEGSIPKENGGGGILGDRDRELLKGKGIRLAPDIREQMEEQRFYLYLALTKPSQYVSLSYARMDRQGQALSPAYLYTAVKELFPHAEETGIAGPFAGKEPEGAPSEEENAAALSSLPECEERGRQIMLSGLSSHAYEGEESALFMELYRYFLKKDETETKALAEASFTYNNTDRISRAVASALYANGSSLGATRLERFASCAYAHFLQYGLRLSERAEYEFRSLDLGNIIHAALEGYTARVRDRRLSWEAIDASLQEKLVDECLSEAVKDYGNDIFRSTSRTGYMLSRAKRLLLRTVWALGLEMQNGDFRPEGFEVSVGGGRIDRLDVLPEGNKVYVKVVDYKTGNTAFELVKVYHGLQLQLAVYMDGAMSVCQDRYPGKEAVPAGLFYYNVKDPVLESRIGEDLGTVSEELLKSLKMNGLVQADPDLVQKMDRSGALLPARLKSDGKTFYADASVASREDFALLSRYVREKISAMKEDIADGEASVLPYRMGEETACEHCGFRNACPFDRKIPGYVYREMEKESREEIFARMAEDLGEEQAPSHAKIIKMPAREDQI